MPSLWIRWMIRRDIAEVLDIAAKSFPSPWGEEDFLERLRQHNCIGLIAEIGEKVVAFFVYELEAKHIHLMNMAVHPSYRRRGIGRLCIQKLASKLLSHRRTRITAILPESNLSAHLFLRACDFRAIQVQRGYDQQTQEDAYHFQFRLGVSVAQEVSKE